MPSSFTVDTDRLIDQLANDLDRVSQENKRLNQIVDAFCMLAGVEASELPTVKERLAEALGRPIQIVVTKPHPDDPKAQRALMQTIRNAERRG